MCILVGDVTAPGALREISGSGAFVETNARPAIGAAIMLRHPEAGEILGQVCAIAEDGIGLRFDRSGGAVAFALAAIALDMSRPR